MHTWFSFLWARSHNGRVDVAALVDGHSMNTRHMADTARILRAQNNVVTDTVQTRVRLYFDGWGHEKMQEDNVKDLRWRQLLSRF